MASRAELPSYQEIRQMVETGVAICPPTPCIRGKAECCTRDIPFSPEDAQVIYRGFVRGEISDSVRQQAVKNERDRKRGDRCVFLGDNNECTIYEHRPLICMAYGMGGQPRNADIANKLAQLKRMHDLTGEEVLIHQDNLIGYACESCSRELEDHPVSYPLPVVEGITAVRLYLSADDVPQQRLPNFVKRQLQQPLAKGKKK